MISFISYRLEFDQVFYKYIRYACCNVTAQWEWMQTFSSVFLLIFTFIFIPRRNNTNWRNDETITECFFSIKFYPRLFLFSLISIYADKFEPIINAYWESFFFIFLCEFNNKMSQSLSVYNIATCVFFLHSFIDCCYTPPVCMCILWNDCKIKTYKFIQFSVVSLISFALFSSVYRSSYLHILLFTCFMHLI